MLRALLSVMQAILNLSRPMNFLIHWSVYFFEMLRTHKGLSYRPDTVALWWCPTRRRSQRRCRGASASSGLNYQANWPSLLAYSNVLLLHALCIKNELEYPISRWKHSEIFWRGGL